MPTLKTIIDHIGPQMIEKIGFFINPLILNLKKDSNHLLVFTFHGIFKSQREKQLNHIDPQNNMTVNQFISFLNYFQRNNYRFISPHDLSKGLNNDQRYAMITFDDGYYNNILAFDILKRYKIPALIFLTTKNITENKSYWWDIIYKYRSKQGSTFEKIHNEQKLLKKIKHSDIDTYILQNFGIQAFKPWSDIDRPFTKEEIKKLAKNPYIFFGNHTNNHAILTHYNKEEIKEELKFSNKIIFALTRRLPQTIAFPNGNFNKQVLETIEEEGFRFAFSTESNKNCLPIEMRDKLICLNRYTTDIEEIKKRAGFWRVGYDPDLLYDELKAIVKNKIKRNRNEIEV